MCLWYHLLVESNEPVYSTLPDLQRGEVGQKVITHKEAHEHPVINSPLEGERGRRWEGVKREGSGWVQKGEKGKGNKIRDKSKLYLPPIQKGKVVHQSSAPSPNTAHAHTNTHGEGGRDLVNPTPQTTQH